MTAAAARTQYIYAIADLGPDSTEPTEALSGIGAHPVECVRAGQLVAFVTPTDRARIRPQRSNLAAHQAVLTNLAENGTILPMRFGTLADNQDAIREMLTRHHDALRAALHRVDGCVEMGLRVRWDVENVAAYLVAEHPELAARRDQLFAAGRAPTHDEKLALGRSFNDILERERTRHAKTIRDVLDEVSEDARSLAPRDDFEVLHLVSLVRRTRLEDFEQGIVEAAKNFNERFAFDYNGPWPPHQFVNVELNW